MKILNFTVSEIIIGVLNFLVFQWFWLRLQGQLDSNDNIEKLQVIGFIIPFTGWLSILNYIYTFREFTVTIWSKK